jgi:hypothetical protein
MTTLCDKILAFFAIACYAGMIYNMGANAFMLPTSQVAANIADPVLYLMNLAQKHFNTRSIPDIRENVEQYTHQYVLSHFIKEKDNLVNKSVSGTVAFLITSKIYAGLLEHLMACLLYLFGIESCKERCDTGQELMSAKSVQQLSKPLLLSLLLKR